MHPFRQVDVFGDGPLLGNPVAVVHDADDLDEAQMQLFARWTNLSETTFLLRPTTEDADYRLRIFTPTSELPFAGHPTLGSAHAWLEAGGRPGADRSSDTVVQECGAGLVTLRRGDRLAFEAPPLVRSGEVSAADRERIVGALGVEESRVVDAQWVDNGPGWVGFLLADARDVLALAPDFAAMRGFDVGVCGPWTDGGSEADLEVRAFVPDYAIGEDPVTGSLNASFGQWLAGGRLPASYVAAQGTAIGRRGRVHVTKHDDGAVWVGGATTTTVHGEVHL